MDIFSFSLQNVPSSKFFLSFPQSKMSYPIILDSSCLVLSDEQSENQRYSVNKNIDVLQKHINKSVNLRNRELDILIKLFINFLSVNAL